MNFLVTLIQIFSAILTIISAVGLFGIPEKLQEFGVQVNHLQVAFALSLIFAILSFIFGPKIKRPEIGRDKKSQFQFFGRNNNQDMH